MSSFDAFIKTTIVLSYNVLSILNSSPSNTTNELLDTLLKLQKRSAPLMHDAGTECSSIDLFQQLNWIKMKNIIMVFSVLKNKAPANLYNLFGFVKDTHNVSRRSAIRNGPLCFWRGGDGKFLKKLFAKTKKCK
jgi:hypothetical protein